jgi:hypothetical protein
MEPEPGSEQRHKFLKNQGGLLGVEPVITPQFQFGLLRTKPELDLIFKNQNQISLRTRILILFMSETRAVTVLLYFVELESDVLHKSKETCTLVETTVRQFF